MRGEPGGAWWWSLVWVASKNRTRCPDFRQQHSQGSRVAPLHSPREVPGKGSVPQNRMFLSFRFNLLASSAER